MNEEIDQYNNYQDAVDAAICRMMVETIDSVLTHAQSKIWHSHPVWFIDGNPIVGYSKQKAGWRLMFWSGADFNEPVLTIRGKKFKDASIFYTKPEQIDKNILIRCLEKSKTIQWDYKNLIKNKGRLDKINILSD